MESGEKKTRGGIYTYKTNITPKDSSCFVFCFFFLWLFFFLLMDVLLLDFFLLLCSQLGLFRSHYLFGYIYIAASSLGLGFCGLIVLFVMCFFIGRRSTRWRFLHLLWVTFATRTDGDFRNHFPVPDNSAICWWWFTMQGSQVTS